MLRQLLNHLVPDPAGHRPPRACLDCRNGVHAGCSGWCGCAMAGHGASRGDELGAALVDGQDQARGAEVAPEGPRGSAATGPAGAADARV